MSYNQELWTLKVSEDIDQFLEWANDDLFNLIESRKEKLEGGSCTTWLNFLAALFIVSLAHWIAFYVQYRVPTATERTVEQFVNDILPEKLAQYANPIIDSYGPSKITWTVNSFTFFAWNNLERIQSKYKILLSSVPQTYQYIGVGALYTASSLVGPLKTVINVVCTALRAIMYTSRISYRSVRALVNFCFYRASRSETVETLTMDVGPAEAENIVQQVSPDRKQYRWTWWSTKGKQD